MSDSGSLALIRSLREASLLIGDLPEAGVFDRDLLDMTPAGVQLNFQQKLGHLYEDALEVLLQTSGRVDVLASHLQVMDADKRTLGELDFILMDLIRRQAIHLELAVKFYLAVEGEDGWQFPGPDPRDNWQRKLDRMRAHQFVLSQQSVARNLLQREFGVEEIEARQLVYGCLFYPMTTAERPLPEAVNPGCRKGRWLYLSEWAEYFSEVARVRVVPKVLWPVELTEMTRGSLSECSVESLHRLAVERCTMFMLPDSLEPIFLVPDTWLNASGV